MKISSYYHKLNYFKRIRTTTIYLRVMYQKNHVFNFLCDIFTNKDWMTLKGVTIWNIALCIHVKTCDAFSLFHFNSFIFCYLTNARLIKSIMTLSFYLTYIFILINLYASKIFNRQLYYAVMYKWGITFAFCIFKQIYCNNKKKKKEKFNEKYKRTASIITVINGVY